MHDNDKDADDEGKDFCITDRTDLSDSSLACPYAKLGRGFKSVGFLVAKDCLLSYSLISTFVLTFNAERRYMDRQLKGGKMFRRWFKIMVSFLTTK